VEQPDRLPRLEGVAREGRILRGNQEGRPLPSGEADLEEAPTLPDAEHFADAPGRLRPMHEIHPDRKHVAPLTADRAQGQPTMPALASRAAASSVCVTCR